MRIANLTVVGLQERWVSMTTGLYCLLVGVIVYWQGATIKFVRTGKNGSIVAEEQNDCKGRVGRSVTGVHGSVTRLQNKAVNGGM